MESTTRWPSKAKPGISTGREPVASTMLPASMTYFLPASGPWPSTSTVLRLVSLPMPAR